MTIQGELFPAAAPLIPGLRLVGDALSQADEAALCARIDAAPLAPFEFGQWRGKRLTTIPGAPPSLDKEPTTCAFAPRCSLAEPACLSGVPPARMAGPDRMARCIRIPAG